MKILIATPYYYPNIVGGAEISTQMITEGLADKEHDVSVLTIGLENSQDVVN